MAAEVKLGVDAVLAINGTEIKNCKDLTVSLEKAEADASTRANNGWRATVGTLKDASIEFGVLNKLGDSAFGMLQGLWSSGTPCDVSISDAGGGNNRTAADASPIDVTIRLLHSLPVFCEKCFASQTRWVGMRYAHKLTGILRLTNHRTITSSEVISRPIHPVRGTWQACLASLRVKSNLFSALEEHRG